MHTRAELRVALAVAAIATCWLTLAATWEIGGAPLAGHYASSVGVGIAAENMLRWGVAGPVLQYVAARPAPADYYCHHPWGVFWTTAALLRVFGRHDFVCRLAPVLLSASTPPLLYAIGRALWRPAAGAAAAAGFVVVPLALAFAQLNALEVPVMAWSLLATWGFVRMAQTGRRSFLAVSAAGTLLALHADWPAFLVLGALLAFVLARCTVLRRFFGAVAHPRLYGAWGATNAALAASTLALYAWLFGASGKLADLREAYDQRSATEGGVSAVAAVLARRPWLELSFTEVGIALGILGVVASVARLARLRREHEVVPLAFLFMATVQYLAFPGGADVHVFWPQYFAVPFALGMGALVATAASLLERRRVTAHPALLALGAALAPLALMLRDALPVLRYARETGGRFDERGALIDSDGDKIAALRWLAERLPRGETVALARSMAPTWSQAWALGGRPVEHNAPPPRGDGSDPFRTWVGDSRRLPDEAQASIARRFHVTAVGPFWIVEPGEAAAPIDAFSFDEREPTAVEWYLVSGTEPVRRVVPDAWRTWELRVHFDQPAGPPEGAPVTADQKRVAHNAALADHDAPRAAALLAELTATMTPRGGMLSDGTEVVGTTRHAGVHPTVTVWLRAGEPAPSSRAQIAVWSQVDARAPLSTIMADPVVREVGDPMAPGPHRWKQGWLYADRAEIRRRPGRERFWVESALARSQAGPRPGNARVEIGGID
jgi:hypothetical protein